MPNDPSSSIRPGTPEWSDVVRRAWIKRKENMGLTAEETHDPAKNKDPGIAKEATKKAEKVLESVASKPTETRVNEMGEASGLGQIVNPKYQLRHSLGVKNFSAMLAFADLTEELENRPSLVKLATALKDVFHA